MRRVVVLLETIIISQTHNKKKSKLNHEFENKKHLKFIQNN